MVDDEIDSLDEAAIALSYRLENLETEVAAHSAETQKMLKRISVERDFSKSLLDTAQVIILTQSPVGRILTLNRYGRLLLGWGRMTCWVSAFSSWFRQTGLLNCRSSKPCMDSWLVVVSTFNWNRFW